MNSKKINPSFLRHDIGEKGRKEMEKAKAISTKTVRFEAISKQYWVKSVRGKAWELWDETEMLKRVARIPAKRVYWVEPY